MQAIASYTSLFQGLSSGAPKLESIIDSSLGANDFIDYQLCQGSSPTVYGVTHT